MRQRIVCMPRDSWPNSRQCGDGTGRLLLPGADYNHLAGLPSPRPKRRGAFARTNAPEAGVAIAAASWPPPPARRSASVWLQRLRRRWPLKIDVLGCMNGYLTLILTGHVPYLRNPAREPAG